MLTAPPIPRTAEEPAPDSHPLQMPYKEYLAWAGEDNRLIEWVNEEVIVHMPPLYIHQDVARFLASLLDGFIQIHAMGRLLSAPFEVKPWPDGPSREPDILFVSNEHLDRFTPQRLEGAPDLVMEIVSEDSVSRDRVDKFDEYEQAGVGEYWLVDPRPGRQRVWLYTLEAGRFLPLLPDEEGRLHSRVLPGFWLRPAWLWQDPPPATLKTLAEVVGPDRLRAAL